MRLRNYQVAAVESPFKYWRQGHKGNPVIAMPTATGKSHVIAGLIKYAHYYWPQTRMMMLTHVQELIEQNLEKILDKWPTAPVGVYSAGLNRKELDNQIIFAGIASIYKLAKSIGHMDLIFVDECHLIGPDEDSMYRQFFEALLEINPNMKVVGLTATPYRLGQGMLTEPAIRRKGGKQVITEPLFNTICIDMTTLECFNWFIDNGYLAPLVPKPTRTIIDISGVGKRGQEFIEKQLQEATDREEITHAAIQETLEVAADRNHWLVFATGIKHAGHVRDELRAQGISAEVIHSKMNDNRQELIRRFKSGEFQALVNVGTLTTGFDFPELDLIVMLRATNSPGLWVQMLGRGTRMAEGKLNCMVMDFAGNTRRLGPINDPIIPEAKGVSKKNQEAPVKLCESCNTFVHASVRICPHCQAEFEIKTKIEAEADTTELIATKKRTIKEPEIHNFNVQRVTYKIHKKRATGQESIKVTYYCGLRMFSHYQCLWHRGTFARKKAIDWWRKAHYEDPNAEVPEDAHEALDEITKFKIPKTITVRTDTKYPDIMSVNFS